MLKDNLYTLNTIEESGAYTYAVGVTLNSHHQVFSGHFPQQPILPGVCLLDMLKEAVCEITGEPYGLAEGNTIKYLKPCDPHQNEKIHFEIILKPADVGLSVTATSYLGDGEANFKFKGKFFANL